MHSRWITAPGATRRRELIAGSVLGRGRRSRRRESTKGTGQGHDAQISGLGSHLHTRVSSPQLLHAYKEKVLGEAPLFVKA